MNGIRGLVRDESMDAGRSTSRRGVWKRAGAAFASVALFGASFAFGSGTAGTLDPSFGNGGVVTFAPPGAAGHHFNDVLVQPDGKILASGQYIASGTTTQKWLVARFTESGALDTSFGAPYGYVTPFAGTAVNLALLADGRIYVCGMVPGVKGEGDAALIRLNGNGTFDTTFGVGGSVVTNILTQGTGKKATRSQDQGADLFVQGDGKVVFAGVALLSGSTGFLARYQSNGTLDTSFGGGDGVATWASRGFNGVAGDAAGGLLCLSNDSLIRFTSIGAFDSTFGERVFATDFFNGNGAMYGLAVQSDGRILASGYRGLAPSPSPAYAMILAYGANGQPDRAYGQNGAAIAGGPLWSGFGVTLDPSGRAVFSVGYSSGGVNSGRIARFDATGALDASFGTGGLSDAATNFLSRQVALDASGRILVAGGSGGFPVVARFVGN